LQQITSHTVSNVQAKAVGLLAQAPRLSPRSVQTLAQLAVSQLVSVLIAELLIQAISAVAAPGDAVVLPVFIALVLGSDVMGPSGDAAGCRFSHQACKGLLPKDVANATSVWQQLQATCSAASSWMCDSFQAQPSVLDVASQRMLSMFHDGSRSNDPAEFRAVTGALIFCEMVSQRCTVADSSNAFCDLAGCALVRWAQLWWLADHKDWSPEWFTTRHIVAVMRQQRPLLHAAPTLLSVAGLLQACHEHVCVMLSESSQSLRRDDTMADSSCCKTRFLASLAAVCSLYAAGCIAPSSVCLSDGISGGGSCDMQAMSTRSCFPSKLAAGDLSGADISKLLEAATDSIQEALPDFARSCRWQSLCFELGLLAGQHCM
jgi:hypothetical protein